MQSKLKKSYIEVPMSLGIQYTCQHVLVMYNWDVHSKGSLNVQQLIDV